MATKTFEAMTIKNIQQAINTLKKNDFLSNHRGQVIRHGQQ